MNAPARVVDLDQDGAEVQVNLEQLGVSAAEVNQQIATAKKFPRSVERFRKDLLGQVTLSETIAASCLYALPRSGKKIEGASIRFAEMAMGAWGNCRATARIVAETENFIVAQGIFIDLERNVAIGIEVNRRIIDSKGERFNIDMIGVTGAAASSIALRNAILRGIPKALTDEAYEAAKRTVAGTLATLSDRRNRMLEAFKPYNVTEQQILAALGKQGLVEIGLQDLVTLGGYLTAIKTEEKDPEELFPQAEAKGARKAAPPEQQATQKGGADQASANSGQMPAGGSQAASAPPPPPAAPPPEDAISGLEMSIADALVDVKSIKDLNAVASMFAVEVAHADADATARIDKLFNDRRAEIVAADDFPGDR